jgi:hypothetical protein
MHRLFEANRDDSGRTFPNAGNFSLVFGAIQSQPSPGLAEASRRHPASGAELRNLSEKQVPVPSFLGAAGGRRIELHGAARAKGGPFREACPVGIAGFDEIDQ